MTDTTNQYDEFVKGLGNRKKRDLKDHTDSIHNVFVDSLDRFVISVGHFIAWFNILLHIPSSITQNHVEDDRGNEQNVKPGNKMTN